MRALIAPIADRYDFIIFDCNPALSGLNISIALASDLIVVPINPDPFSKMGFEKVIEEFTRMGSDYDQVIDYTLLFTLHDAREAASRKNLIEFGSRYEDRMFGTVIKKNADVKTAIDHKRAIFDYRKASARPDFDAFALEVLGVEDPVKAGNA